MRGPGLLLYGAALLGFAALGMACMGRGDPGKAHGGWSLGVGAPGGFFATGRDGWRASGLIQPVLTNPHHAERLHPEVGICEKNRTGASA